DLAALLEAKGIALNQHTRLHVFCLAVTSGLAAFGPDIGGNTALVAREDWLGKPGPHDRDAALRDLARRYFAAFGPATEADFAGWAGLPLRDVRAGMSAIASELREVRIGDVPAWLPKTGAPRARSGVLRLLPAFDTYLMGHRERDFIAPPKRWKVVMPGGGILKPAIVVDGAAVGIWAPRRQGGRLKIELHPFGRLDAAVREAVEAEVR